MRRACRVPETNHVPSVECTVYSLFVGIPRLAFDLVSFDLYCTFRKRTIDDS